MAALLLLTGFGGQYTTEAFTTASAVGADTLDASRVAQLAFQCKVVGAPGGTYAVEQSFDNKSWKNLVATAAVASGNIQLVGITSGPFGMIRINPASVTSLSASVTLAIEITGFPLPAWE